MPTTAIQFTPQVVTINTPIVGNVTAQGTTASPQPVLSMLPVVTLNGATVTPSSLVLDSLPVNGSAAVSGTAVTYQASPGYAGPDSFTFHAIVGGVPSNVATASVSMLVGTCDELGRVTRNVVSGYTLSRPTVTRVRRMAKRCVVANFNGALTKGRTIVAVRWETTSPWAIFMENARIISGQRQSAVDVTFNFAGWGGVLCTATLDNGEVYNAEFSFTVTDSPLYPTATYPNTNGPFRLDAYV